MKKIVILMMMVVVAMGVVAQRPQQPVHSDSHRMKAPLVFQSHDRVHFSVYVDNVLQNHAPATRIKVSSEVTDRSEVLVVVEDGDRLAGKYIRLHEVDASGTYWVVYFDNLVDVYTQAEYDDIIRHGGFQVMDNGAAEDVYGHVLMSPAEFEGVQRQLKETAFDDSRLDLMKVVLSGHYLAAQQIKTLMSSFSFDDNRLKFAELAYSSCLDPEDYYVVVEGLTFKSNKDKLMEYIQSCHGQVQPHEHGHNYSGSHGHGNGLR